MKALSGSANYTLAVDYPGVQGGGGPAAYSGVYGFSGPAGIYAYGMDWDPTVENAPAAGAYNPTDGTGAQGSILVGDYWNYKVQRFSVNGQHLDTYNDVTGPKANGGIPSAPYDIAADPTDPVGGGASFWAADQGSSQHRRVLAHRRLAADDREAAVDGDRYGRNASRPQLRLRLRQRPDERAHPHHGRHGRLQPLPVRV